MTVTIPSLTKPTTRKGKKKRSSQRDSLLVNVRNHDEFADSELSLRDQLATSWSRKILVAGDFGYGRFWSRETLVTRYGKLSNAVECTAEYDIDHKLPRHFVRHYRLVARLVP
ncbi:hypothetical protein E4U59_004627 [Claviceps monticola]|nr:hypothetical protein E4U59_004627 [Claviceps monticola]